VKRGASRDRIIVSIGPHIGACCYSVPPERARRFLEGHRYARAVTMRQEQWYLDLASVNTVQMIDAGIPADHIDGSDYCTSCRVDEFFSYRKDTGESYGEIMGFIAFSA
jgi:copper oxidase (laccase) domain-containing protein